MKTYTKHPRKRQNLLLKSALLALLLLLLVGCSGGNDNSQSSPDQTELDQLKEENEKLREELEASLSNSKEETKNEDFEIEADESTTESQPDIIPELQAEQLETVSDLSNLVPPEHEPEELLIGEWFYQDFYEEGFFSWAQSMVFNANGSGTINRTYYVPREEAEEYPFPMEDFDIASGLSWSLDGDTVHVTTETGEDVELTFSSELQQMDLKGGSDKYIREKSAIPEGYAERCLFVESIASKAKREMVERSFLGTWYFDVLTWTFNDDGTGVIDIPAIGDQPSVADEFSYTVSVTVEDTEVTYLCLMIDWPDSGTSYFWPDINDDGSIILNGTDDSEPIKLTRTFDLNNCPISAEIISTGLGVISGSIFYDFLS